MPELPILGITPPEPGKIKYGQWEAFHHPTGNSEFLPVIIAKGQYDGPCFWLTAGIHGPEHGGPVVIYRLLTQELMKALHGTIIAIPALNPIGLRTMQRQPQPIPTDPNRLWPDGKPRPTYDPDRDPPSSVEMAFQRLFEEIIRTADFMIDYHNSWTGSLSFAFQDRILYKDDQQSDVNKAEAEALFLRQQQMLRAYGHTIVCELPAEKLLDEDLHRATTASVLYSKKIPTVTLELGTGHVPDPAIINASIAGTRNVLRWAGMLGGSPEPISNIKVIDLGFPVRRRFAPRVERACVVLHLMEAGDRIQVGDPVAEIRDVWGRPLDGGYILSQDEGFVVGRHHGIYYYPGEAILTIAIRNDAAMVAPYPKDYFSSRE
jgi:predicted deacylase